ncbi:uncharacterized protein (DUF2147 family) [Dyadobacter jejuensis]|uniref:Uncharacterized protein (DUF2147 family) n=1 Tax=Dyadobacter jejuensis TaxID=1082580 RepID=A0A316AMM2_9BACT|nr:DUF2147 domain-containing protein [Dyadobacter jejuensis]PWJ58983.1 uncharacterized protein (DUF2147 family) [Dyadobacter jejuensis]
MGLYTSFIKFVFLLFLLGAGSPLRAQKSEADKVIGEWINEEKNEIIEIYKNGETYAGKLIWDKSLLSRKEKALRRDSQNPDPELRKRSVYKIDVLYRLEFHDGQWENGKLYDPHSGRTYSCLLKLNDQLLQIRGYVGIPLLGRSSYWKRNN